MIRILKRLRYCFKRLFGKKMLTVAMSEGAKGWADVNDKYGGPLSKTKYLTKAGKWKKGGQDKYESEKKDRQEMWFNVVRMALTAAFPQYRGITSLLFTVLGMLGMEDKLNI